MRLPPPGVFAFRHSHLARSQAANTLETSILAFVVLAAILQSLLGFAGFMLLSQNVTWEAGGLEFRVTQLLVRFGAGVLLIVAGFGDRRTLLFGTGMLLTAAAFSRKSFAYLVDSEDMNSLRVFCSLPLEALIPFYFWQFARLFPTAFLRTSLDRVIGWAERTSLIVGLLLIVSNLALLFYPQAALLNSFDATDKYNLFHPLLYGLVIPIPLVLWLRMRSAREEERRRVKVFVFGLLVTIVPALIYIVLEGVSADFRELVLSDRKRIFMESLIHTLIITTPFITTYAVLVERLLPINILLRQASRYWLGNGFIALGVALPLLLLGYYLYNSRTLSIAAILDGYNGLFIAVALGFSLIMFEQRHKARQYLDELFYRTGYDSGNVLAGLAQSAQSCTSLAEVSAAMQAALDQSLRPQNSHLLFVSNERTLRDPRQELADLPLQSTLATELLALREPLHVRDISTASGGADERWLSQANASVLLPIKVKAVNSGVLVLGSKRSELPYTQVDFDFLYLLLNTITAPCGHLFDTWNALERDKRAVQCNNCGAVMAGPNHCTTCGGGQFIEALLPKVLHQHYEVTRVLGGSLGTVYLAHETRLQRSVVLKTVASASVEELQFLRDEARVMATVSHPHIANIYGLESYQGMPILVCEYLPGGTLEDILRDGYLAQDEVLVVINQMLQALIYLHGRGIAHGDVKPSNIGFDLEETAKLLDFGLANRFTGVTNAVAYVGGTYAYMSPEKIQQQHCDERADLWALAVILLEALYGFNPFAAGDLPGIVDKVTNPEATLFAAVASPSTFLQIALSNDITRRPQTAEQFITLMRAAFNS